MAGTPCPLLNIAGVGVGQSALNQLPRHESSFRGVGLFVDSNGGVDDLALGAGRRSVFFDKVFKQPDLSDWNKPGLLFCALGHGVVRPSPAPCGLRAPQH